MMDGDGAGLGLTLISFIIGFSVLVFIHEWGHYGMARLFGIRVDSFAIGFGKEVFGWTNATTGVRWKFCLLPLGGYVKFHGDASAASNKADIDAMPAAERAECFHFRPVWQRALVVFAGPAINLIAAALVFAGFALVNGVAVSEPVIDRVVEGSAAETAGLLPGDRILRIDDRAIDRFDDIGSSIRLFPGQRVTLEVERQNEVLAFPLTIGVNYLEDRWGNRYAEGRLGVASGPVTRTSVGVFGALGEGVVKTVDVARSIFITLRQLVMGLRSLDEVGGPVRIVGMTGEAAAIGLTTLIWFLAMISVNLGVVNLLPIPVLDGGHLLFYLIEWVKGSPVSEKFQEVGFMAGMAVMLLFMVVVTFNDLQIVAG